MVLVAALYEPVPAPGMLGPEAYVTPGGSTSRRITPSALPVPLLVAVMV